MLCYAVLCYAIYAMLQVSCRMAHLAKFLRQISDGTLLTESFRSMSM